MPGWLRSVIGRPNGVKLAVILASTLLLAALIGSPAAAGHAPPLLSGRFDSVVLSYGPGLAVKAHPCVAYCRRARILATRPAAVYGRWETRHLIARLNRLRWIGPNPRPHACPADRGDGYRLRFVGTLIVVQLRAAASGCRFVTSNAAPAATREGTTALLDRLRALFTVPEPRLVRGRVVSVHIDYTPGMLTTVHPCPHAMTSCHAAAALAARGLVKYGAWEAAHLAARLNHLRRLLPTPLPYNCPLSWGDGYTVRFIHPSGLVTTLDVPASGCTWVTNDRAPRATRWANPDLLHRLGMLVMDRQPLSPR